MVFKKAYITRTLKRNALRKGLLGGSPFWRAIWAAQLLLKGWGKVSKGGEAPITFDESLKEGDAWTLVHTPEKNRKHTRKFLSAPSAERINEILGPDRVVEPPPTRRERKAKKKQQRSDAKAIRVGAKGAKKDAKEREKAELKAAKRDEVAASRSEKAEAKAAARAEKEHRRASSSSES